MGGGPPQPPGRPPQYQYQQQQQYAHQQQPPMPYGQMPHAQMHAGAQAFVPGLAYSMQRMSMGGGGRGGGQGLTLVACSSLTHRQLSPVVARIHRSFATS